MSREKKEETPSGRRAAAAVAGVSVGVSRSKSWRLPGSGRNCEFLAMRGNAKCSGIEINAIIVCLTTRPLFMPSKSRNEDFHFEMRKPYLFDVVKVFRNIFMVSSPLPIFQVYGDHVISIHQ